jgi:hypothetical protein
MGVFHCIICHQKFSYVKEEEVNFLWDDEGNYGKPVCWNCGITVYDNPHYNLGKNTFKERINRPPKKIGMEKWL